MVKEDLSRYITISGLLESYKNHMGCKNDLKGLVIKVNAIRERNGLSGSVSLSTVKKWSAGISFVPSLNSLLKLFILPEYAEQVQKIHRKLQKERKRLNEQKKMIRMENKEKDVLPKKKDIYGLSVDVSDKGYPREPLKDCSPAEKKEYKIEKSLRPYNESSYIRKMNFAEEEAKGIEELLKILFDDKEISVFRYSVNFFMSLYTLIGMETVYVDDFKSHTKYLPYGTAEYIRSKTKTVRKIIDRYLYYMSDSMTHYSDICGTVNRYKKWRGVSAKFDCSEEVPKLLSDKEYKEVLMNSAPDFKGKEYIVNPLSCKYLKKITLADLYNVCNIASKWDNKPVRVFSDLEDVNIISEESLSYEGCRNQLPYSIKEYAYIGHGYWTMPETYLAILDRLITKKETVSTYTQKKKVLFINKNIGEGRVYEISLELTPLGKEFIKWYEKFFEGTDYLNYQTLTVTSYKRKENKGMGLFTKDNEKKVFADKKDFKKFYEKYTDKEGNNVLYSKKLAMTMDRWKSNRTGNNLIIGSTGTGKDWGYLKPNLAELGVSRVIVDSTDDNFRTFAPYLIEQGYIVYNLDLCNPQFSNHYNPLEHLYNDDGTISEVKVETLVKTYMENNNRESGKDAFWYMAEEKLITLLIYYVLENDDIWRENKCFNTILEKLKLASEKGMECLTAEIYEFTDNQAGKGIETKIRLYYDTVLELPEQTLKEVIASLRAGLNIFAQPDIDWITRWNSRYNDININFDNLAKTETYLFVTLPQTDKKYNMLSAMFFIQLVSRLYELGENNFVDKWCIYKNKGVPAVYPFDTKEEAVAFQNDNLTEENIVELPYANNTRIYYLVWKNKIFRKSFSKKALMRLIKDIKKYPIENTNSYFSIPSLPMQVELIFNEFGFYDVPSIDIILATCQKYRIGTHLIVQSINQITNRYSEDKKITILANIDRTLFLGSPIPEDMEYLQKRIGKATTVLKKKGNTKVVDSQYLASREEIRNIISQKKCILTVRDIPPFADDKLNFSEHPAYQMIMDAKDGLEIIPYFSKDTGK